ncbi:metallophosphoesterase [Cupriavidus sp. Agwp_2]|uniref:metallophosphoesterase n=1 Tax=Cupriavidus sp. Agwp_2 TaxID=2897324 RepID=UPI0034602CDC
MKRASYGRGRGFTAWRGILESALAHAYVGDWPARLWGFLPSEREVTTTRLTLTLPPGDGRACRIAFISDLHIGPTTPIPLLERTFDIIRHERPDVLLLGGDYVFLEAYPHRLATLSRLVGSIPCDAKLAVLGNHDLWTWDHAITAALSKAGATVLVNDVVELPPPWSDVVVLGLDDPWTGNCDPCAAAAKIGKEAFRLVLCHSPDGLSSLTGIHFDLFLAGHTHGGQIAMPSGPIVLPNGPMCRLYPSGLSRFESRLVYTSRGIGTVDLPLRTFAPPDLLMLELERPSAQPMAVAKISSVE